MLAYILAFVVGLGSLAIYIAAFFFPEIHRKNDFIWSGVGLFYALVLWVFAPRITGGLLLGHIASVALLVWFGWQTLSLRRQLTPQVEQTPVPSPETVKTGIQEQVSKFSLQEKLAQLQGTLGNIFSGAKNKAQQTITKKTTESPRTETKTAKSAQKPAVEIIDKTSETPEAPAETKSATEDVPEVTPTPPTKEVVAATDETQSATEDVPEATPPHPASAEMVAAAQVETEEKAPIPVAEIAPDTTLAPSAEAPPEQIPPNNQAS
ncbi:Ycf66 family protein [Nodularia chucula]|uniref:Ycf66 family protein n=1 Tax=Nodularia chucula TaxID=3093667 RepID=UPI0039C674A0